MGKDRKPRTVIGPGGGKTFRGCNPDRQAIPNQRSARELRDLHLDRLRSKYDRATSDKRVRMRRLDKYPQLANR